LFPAIIEGLMAFHELIDCVPTETPFAPHLKRGSFPQFREAQGSLRSDPEQFGHFIGRQYLIHNVQESHRPAHEHIHGRLASSARPCIFPPKEKATSTP
jgi:hypothetical protein